MPLVGSHPQGGLASVFSRDLQGGTRTKPGGGTELFGARTPSDEGNRGKEACSRAGYMDAGIPGGRICQATTQLTNMPRRASQMPSLLKCQTHLQNHWRNDFFPF